MAWKNGFNLQSKKMHPYLFQEWRFLGGKGKIRAMQIAKQDYEVWRKCIIFIFFYLRPLVELREVSVEEEHGGGDGEHFRVVYQQLHHLLRYYTHLHN